MNVVAQLLVGVGVGESTQGAVETVADGGRVAEKHKTIGAAVHHRRVSPFSFSSPSIFDSFFCHFFLARLLFLQSSQCLLLLFGLLGVHGINMFCSINMFCWPKCEILTKLKLHSHTYIFLMIKCSIDFVRRSIRPECEKKRLQFLKVICSELFLLVCFLICTYMYIVMFVR